MPDTPELSPETEAIIAAIDRLTEAVMIVAKVAELVVAPLLEDIADHQH